jgi:iron(III) transport system ATP-binding protein
MDAGPLLELREVYQAYDGHAVVKGLSFALARGAIGCLLGQSGCGKTTALRCIAGFEPVTRGEIRLGGRGSPRPA